MTMDVGMYNNQSGYSAEYYQQSGGYQVPYEGYHEGYYEPPSHYYEPILPGQSHEPVTPVISTDTGLCYTNLDYGELQPSYPLHPLPHPDISHPIRREESLPSLPRPEEMHMHEPKIDNHYLETKYNMHFVDESMQYSTGSPLPGADFEPYQPKDEYGALREFPREDCGQLHLQHQAHSSHAVPTYKWMQVKRNVPKPSGEYNIIDTSLQFRSLK